MGGVRCKQASGHRRYCHQRDRSEPARVVLTLCRITQATHGSFLQKGSPCDAIYSTGGGRGKWAHRTPAPFVSLTMLLLLLLLRASRAQFSGEHRSEGPVYLLQPCVAS